MDYNYSFSESKAKCCHFCKLWYWLGQETHRFCNLKYKDSIYGSKDKDTKIRKIHTP